MMLVQTVMDPAGGPQIMIHTPAKTTVLGITPTGEMSLFFVMVQDPQFRIQFPVQLPVQTAEEGLALVKERDQMDPLIAAARQEVLKQIEEQRVRQSLATPGLPPAR